MNILLLVQIAFAFVRFIRDWRRDEQVELLAKLREIDETAAYSDGRGARAMVVHGAVKRAFGVSQSKGKK